MDKDYDIVVAFQRIEEELINSMIGNIKRHTDWEKTEGFEWSMWQAEQLKALEKYRSTNINKFKGYFSTINEQIDEVLEKAYEKGNMQQEIEILSALREGYIFKKRKKKNITLNAKFFRINDRKLNALIKATKKDFKKAQLAMLRMANDQYRKIIFNAQVYANTGAGTIKKAIDMASRDFMANGINCIEYKNGARVNVVKYVDMAIRTANKRAYLQGEGDKRREWGISTVVIATRGKGCPKCVPHQGKIYIDDVWSGGSSKDGPYPLLSSAIEKGLYHPNCRDTHTTYFEGITTKPIKPTKEQQEENIRDYNEEQKQKYIDRQINKYDNLKKRSFDNENKIRYKNKKKEWKQLKRKIKQSGGKYTKGDVEWYMRREEEAELYYQSIRNRKDDVLKIAKNTSLPLKMINKIKNHVFYDKHILYDGSLGYLDSDYDMGVAWQRLINGNYKSRDKLLLKHEYLECNLEKRYNLTNKQAHDITIRKYDWHSKLKLDKGELGEDDCLNEIIRKEQRVFNL